MSEIFESTLFPCHMQFTKNLPCTEQAAFASPSHVFPGWSAGLHVTRPFGLPSHRISQEMCSKCDTILHHCQACRKTGWQRHNLAQAYQQA